jgi:hypothetical protein
LDGLKRKGKVPAAPPQIAADKAKSNNKSFAFRWMRSKPKKPSDNIVKQVEGK